jgi:hypothetical protein
MQGSSLQLSALPVTSAAYAMLHMHIMMLVYIRGSS